MNGKSQTQVKLLPKTQGQEPERDEPLPTDVRRQKLYNIGIALATAMLVAFVLLPRTPILEKGETATRDIRAPYTLYIEYEGPDMVMVSHRVSKGDLLVESGHRVTERAALALQEIAHREGIGNRPYAYAGLVALFLILLYLFYRDIKRYRPALISDTGKMLLLALLLFFTIAMAQASKFVFSLLADRLHLDLATIGFALPVAAGAMLTSLLLDFHLALGFSFIVSILLGIAFQGDPFIPIFLFLGSIIAALRVVRCKRRTALLKAGAYLALVNLLVIVCIDLYRGELMTRGPADLIAGVFGAITATMIVSVTLPFFESLFDIATDIRLLELMDPNQPLLKDLVFKSPGTYHHSILIGNLAEAAAEAIGENPILARVGAYYHDIGKILKPEYYIENQRTTENKHDKLAPSMSSLIIGSHVKDGVELAKANRLPAVVIDIIKQHHGTSIITYFYEKAKGLHAETPIAEEDYRYPGPRPRTKIAAIVMLSDAVEAASRTIEDPTPERIQALTSGIISHIFLDDQLAMCDLTLKDLREISKSFNLVLTGIFHHRIDYPGMDFSGEKRQHDRQDKKQAESQKHDNRDKDALSGAAHGPRSS